MGLAGKFIFHMGEEYSRSGEIIEQVSDDVILVKFDHNCDCTPRPQGALPVTINSLATGIEDMDNTCEIFNTRADLDAFLEWLDTPSERSESAKIVKLVN
jgi:hypothetical protein